MPGFSVQVAAKIHEQLKQGKRVIGNFRIRNEYIISNAIIVPSDESPELDTLYYRRYYRYSLRKDNRSHYDYASYNTEVSQDEY